ncbi:MAG: hypothetical protein V7K27_20060 [Nostoc sp.]|uniref:hypothetical protein n=1 Tax=Nostoc sp. TaxID=1180 RepID=UPI002FF49FCB
MQFKLLKLGITQLSPDFFVLTHKINHKMFRNSPSIPEPARWAALPTCSDWRPATDSEYRMQWESPGGFR